MATRAAPKVVLSIDDHPLIRSALREVLSAMAPRIEVLEAPEPESALVLLRERQDVDFIFLDLHFARHNGLDFVGALRSAAPAAPLVVYTVREDPATLRRALASGACGIIPKTHSRELLQAAIELVMQGGVYLPPELARLLARPETATLTVNAPVAISEQQRKILGLLGKGLPNKEIARKLGIASSTVKNQLTVVFERLGVSNRTQAVIAARAVETGEWLVQRDPDRAGGT
jgi:DNA-binding NarL/FixJ family response regulator